MTTITLSNQIPCQQVDQHIMLDHYRIGPYDIAVDCCVDKVMADFAHLYRHCRQNDINSQQIDTDKIIVIKVVPEKYSFPLRKTYRLFGDGQMYYTHRKFSGVLPHLEWVINRRVSVRHLDYLQLHSATVSYKGQGVIFAAKSSCGKSTLAAGLISRGWQYFSDEFALIDRQTGYLEPFPKAICVKTGSFDIMREMGLPLWRNHHYATPFKGPVGYITPADINDDVVSPPCPVKSIILPQYTPGQAPRLTKLSRAETLIEMAELAFNRHAFGESSIELLSRIT